jgi:hypothetical protein
MSGPIDSIRYHSDDGQIYTIGAPRWAREALDIPVHVGVHSPPPHDLKPRRVMLVHPNGRMRREIVVDDAQHPAWTGQVQTLQMPDWTITPGSPLVAYRITGRISERVSGTRTRRRTRRLPPGQVTSVI